MAKKTIKSPHLYGYKMKEGWTNPNNEKNMKKGGFFYASEVNSSNK